MVYSVQGIGKFVVPRNFLHAALFFTVLNRLFPDVKRKGIKSIPQLVIFTSEQVSVATHIHLIYDTYILCMHQCPV